MPTAETRSGCALSEASFFFFTVERRCVSRADKREGPNKHNYKNQEPKPKKEKKWEEETPTTRRCGSERFPVPTRLDSEINVRVEEIESVVYRDSDGRYPVANLRRFLFPLFLISEEKLRQDRSILEGPRLLCAMASRIQRPLRRRVRPQSLRFLWELFFFLDCLSSADDGPFLHFSPRQSHFHTTGTEWQKKKTKKTIRKQVAGNSVLALKKARIWERCRLLSVADVFLSPVEIIYKQFPNNLKWRTTLRSTMCVRFSTVSKPQRRWRLRTTIFFFSIRLFNTVTSS